MFQQPSHYLASRWRVVLVEKHINYTFLIRRKSLWSNSNWAALEGLPLSIISGPPNEAYISLKKENSKVRIAWSTLNYKINLMHNMVTVKWICNVSSMHFNLVNIRSIIWLWKLANARNWETLWWICSASHLIYNIPPPDAIG